MQIVIPECFYRESTVFIVVPTLYLVPTGSLRIGIRVLYTDAGGVIPL